jgi:hypothetical protein
MRMSQFENRESRGERSLRLAIEADQKQKEELERQKRVEMKKKRREQSVHNAFNRAAKPESRSLSPPESTRRPKGLMIRPASRSPVRAPPARPGSPPPQRTPSPFETPDTTVATNEDGKAKSPTPTISLNDEQGKPSIPKYVLPAAHRRPVSIFAPKPKRRV